MRRSIPRRRVPGAAALRTPRLSRKEELDKERAEAAARGAPCLSRKVKLDKETGDGTWQLPPAGDVISLGDLSGPPVASPVCDDLRKSIPAPCQDR